MEATSPWASQHFFPPELSPNHLAFVSCPMKTQLCAAKNSHPGHTQVLTAGNSALARLQLPLLAAKGTVCCNDTEKQPLFTNSFSALYLILKPGTFSHSPNPFLGGDSRIRSNAKDHSLFLEEENISTYIIMGIESNLQSKHRHMPQAPAFLSTLPPSHRENLRKKSRFGSH